jgi:exodeoxyribonuclease VII large subunit
MDQLTMDFEAEAKEADAQPKILSVSDVNKAVKGTLESNYKLIWVKGEISNFKPHSSGHFYFSLKDSKAQISAMMFKGANSGLKFKPHDGLEVIVRGRVSVYEPRGTYSINCELMDPVGAGALQLAFDQLKKKLELEGLFKPERKRPIPLLPRHVAVVTSQTGAAIRDILNVLGRRFKGLRVTVIPAIVQGDQCPGSVVAGIELAQRLGDVDVMIVGRGGGSIEDMWGFNDERVARAIFASKIPVISAVGHEIDFTIADFVADLRAPTPSAAAELVVKNAAEIHEQILNFKRRLWRAYQHQMEMYRQRVFQLSKRLVDPKRRLADLTQRCDELSERLEGAMDRYVEKRAQQIKLLMTRLPSPLEQIYRTRQALSIIQTRMEAFWLRTYESKSARIAALLSVLDSLSPAKVVARGFSITRKAGALVREVSQLKKGDEVEIEFVNQGKALARIESIQKP